jgi:CRP-like cAMP-binding protein
MKSHTGRLKKTRISQEDSQFLLDSEIFKAVPDHAKSHLLACLARVAVEEGERFIRQGEQGNSLYLIQDGSCTVLVDKDGVETPVACRKSGDLIGEMALCTGEKRTAHIQADTDMTLWRMNRVEFDQMCLEYPDLREFITEIVTNRISGSKFAPHRTIGKHVITDVIAEGGWAIVYKGLHESLNMPVAIKMLKHTMAMDADFMEKFLNEAKVIARLNHPNIVRVHDIEHLYRTVFIVMEYLSGLSLEYILRNMPRLTISQVLDYLVQVAQGLQYAHSHGIVHQDIKPANLFIGKGERLKIVDFGLACPVGAEDELDFAGTPHYMAPEQITGDLIDERTDIYSLGITAFEMATGRRPFPGEDVAAILRAHRDSPVPDPCTLNPDLPKEFNAFVQHATQKDPAERYQTVHEALTDLIPLAERHSLRHPANRARSRDDMVLLMSYGDVDKAELTKIVEDFSQRLKGLGVELRVANFQDQ